MKKEFFKYLSSYSFDPIKVNRIIVSNFLFTNGIESCQNLLIEKLRIKTEEKDFDELLRIVETYSISTLEDLIEAFEFVISPEEKVISGAVYTPEYIRKYIVDNTVGLNSDIVKKIKVCDPACGCSGFLITAAKRIKKLSGRTYSSIFRNNLYGLDIQEFSISRSEILLSLCAIIEGEDEEKFDFNLYLGNALSFDWTTHLENFIGFDAIIGNPPYVCSRNIERESRDLISNWSVSKSGHPDLYIPFFEIGVLNLKPNGTLGFITMNTFFKSVNGRALREYLCKQKLSMGIVDFGAFQVFQSKSTYTCICLIKKTHASNLNYIRLNDCNSLLSNGLPFQSINYEELDFENGWNLQERDILNRIEKTGAPLGKRFITRNGIATLRNEVYIFEPVDEDENFYFLQNGQQYSIEREICVDIVNPNKLTNENTIEPLRKKAIFPYYFRNEKPIILLEEDLVLRFPNAYNYLVSKKEVLASRDKGKGKDYEVWYAYGRNQSLEHYEFKLFFPHISPSIPYYVFNNEPNLLFVNGLAIIGKNERELRYLQKIMSSRLFWFYIVNSSKPYGSGYFSLSKTYVKNFGIYDLTKDQIDHLLNLSSQDEVNVYLEELYDIDLSKMRLFVDTQQLTLPIH